MSQTPGGRVYSITQRGGDPPTDVVVGTTSLFGTRARTLFDIRASRLFISRSFAHDHGFEVKQLNARIQVLTPSGSINSRDFCQSCPILLGDRVFSSDLVLIPLREFDVVLGIDWLTRHHATIDCELKNVPLVVPGKEFVYQECKSTFFALYVSASRAKQMILGWCVAYLASVDVTTRPMPPLSDMRVAREFPDDFPNELPGMPPERETEFTIELIPGTTPISKAPYRMTFTELKEAKAQLDDLLANGLIRPSAPPWGVPFLFVTKKNGRLQLCIEYTKL